MIYRFYYIDKDGKKKRYEIKSEEPPKEIGAKEIAKFRNEQREKAVLAFNKKFECGYTNLFEYFPKPKTEKKPVKVEDKKK